MVHDVITMLEQIYAGLPDINCKGLCWNSCGPIDMSDVERQRITDLGVDIPLFTEDRARRWSNDEKGDLYCSALSFGAHEGGMGCTVYEVRPLICRVWGLGEGDMACPHGCERSGSLTHPEIYRLIAETFQLGGHAADMDLNKGMATLEALMADPEYADLVARMMAGDMSVAPQIETAVRKLRGA